MDLCRLAAWFFLQSIPFSLFSLYNGNTALPEMPENGFFLSDNSCISVKLGYEGDFLFGRNIGISSSGNDPSIRSMLNGGTFSLGFINRIELYSLLGVTTTKVAFHEGGKIELKTPENFGGEVGIRANTPVWGDLKFGADAKYFYAWPTLESAEVQGKVEPASSRILQKEWQVGISFSQTFAFFTPYAGVKFGKFRMKFIDLKGLSDWISSNTISFYNKSCFGFFIGLGLSLQYGVYANLEFRCVDENALTAALGFSF
jgi:hypothetical protein